MASPSRISRRDVLKAGAYAGMGAALSACVPGASAPGSPSASRSIAVPSGTATASPSPQLTGRVDYWHHFGGSETIEAGIAKQFDAFRAKYPDIDFRPDPVPNPEYMAKLTTAAQTGTLPDAALIASSRFVDTFGMGAVTDITDRIRALPTFGDYPEAYFRTVEDNGSWYGVPHWLAADGCLYYRKDWLDEAGFSSPPETWEELQEIAIAITDPAQNRYGYGMRAGDLFGAAVLLAVIESFGTDIINENKEPAMDRDRTIEAVTFYSELFTRHKVVPPSVTADGFTQVRAGFETGQTGMLYLGFNALAPILDNAAFPAENVGLTAAPGRDRSASWITIVSNVMTSDRNPDATWAWLAHWADPGVQAEFFADTSNLPTLQSAYEDPRVTSVPYVDAAIKAIEVGRPAPQFPGYTGFIEAINATWQAVLLGQMTPTAWTDDAITKLEQTLA
jgi:multiple sugar transport system substrate-binding protein